MAAPLAFIYLPTTDLEASLRWYRDELGHDELWREGDDTVGLAVPDTDIGLMLDRVPVGDESGPGPMFLTDDVEKFVADHPELEPATPVIAIPDGALVSFRDPAGNWVYVLDQHQAV